MAETAILIIPKETYAEIDIMRGSEKIGFAEVSGTELCRFNIFEPFQNKGYGQEALKQLIERYGIDELCVATDNDRAMHIYEKAGFVITKTYVNKMERV